MELSQNGLDHIKRLEGANIIGGFHYAYQDQAGVWTIGYGHTVSAGRPVVKPNMVITEEEAEDILRRDVSQFQRAVAQAVKRPITQNQFDAFVSLCFNIGTGAFRSSTALRRFNNGDVQGAAEAMAWWNKITVNGEKRVSKGLANRRASEVALFLDDDDDDLPPSVKIEGGEHKPLRNSSTMMSTSAGLLSVVAGLLGSIGNLSETVQLTLIGLLGLLAVVIAATMGRRIWDHITGVE